LFSSSVPKPNPVRMSTSATPSNPTPAGDDRNLVAVDASTAVTFEEKVHLFWKKNRTAVFAVCVIVLLAIVGKEGWEYMARQKELDVEKAYAAATTPELLKSFAAAHPDHALGGIAQLRIADEAYKNGKSDEAVSAYDKAISALKEGPLAARAQIGRALAKVQAGKTADAAGELKKLADDANTLKAVRAEAAYHLTTLAVDNHNADEAQKYVDQLMKIDISSPWTQRAMALRATLPTTPAPAPQTSTPASGQKKDDSSSGVQVKLPGK
jgi:hypothetical protein